MMAEELQTTATPPDQATPPPSNAVDRTADKGEGSGSVTETNVTGAGGGSFSWDDDRNPHKYVAAQLYQQNQLLQQQLAQVAFQQEAAGLIQQGIPPEQVQQYMALRQREMQLGAAAQQMDQQARPIVAQVLAERISKAFNVNITADELLTTSTGAPIDDPKAMLARADALIQERRRANYAKRQEQGADKVERAAGVSGPDPERLKGMTPTQLLKLGLQRMSQ